MPVGPPTSAPASNAQNIQTSSHCHCCPCAVETAGSVYSDSSTVKEAGSDSTESPSTVVPEYHGGTCHSHATLLRRKHAHQRPVLSGLSGFSIHIRTVTNPLSDPFDYEQKYPPDETFKEMSERSRVFKTYMDECTKFDFDMVENWRDGLDMLLVFVSSLFLYTVERVPHEKVRPRCSQLL